MGEPKTVRLRQEIKEQARLQELRMRQKEPLIASGDWKHWRQMPLAELIAKAEANIAALKEMATSGRPITGANKEAADLSNHVWMIAKQLAVKDLGLRRADAEEIAGIPPGLTSSERGGDVLD